MTNTTSSFGGLALTLGQRLAIKGALLKLKLQESLPNITFWGKIIGSEKDYFIAKSIIPGKMSFKTTYYVSVDEGVSFSELQECSKEAMDKASELKFEMFKGNLQFKYGPAPEIEEDAEDGKVPDDSRLSELERLYYCVSSIDSETCLVPKGAFLLTATSKVEANKGYSGMPPSDLKKASSYALFRKPIDHKTITKNKCSSLSDRIEFLDGITSAKPKGIWAIQTDATGLSATIRHLGWTGYEFHITAGESGFESAYFGYGLYNHDIALMI